MVRQPCPNQMMTKTKANNLESMPNTSRIEDIIRSGCAPGMNTKAKDPLSADVAVPKAFKQLEQTQSASKIAKEAGWSINTIRRTWGM